MGNSLKTVARAMALLASGFSMCLARSIPVRDPGVSPAHLESIGSAKADKLLIGKLADPANSAYFAGIVDYLGPRTGRYSVSSSVREALIQFVEQSVAVLPAQGGESQDTDRVLVLSDALAVVGCRGGKAGVEYLGKWLDGKALEQRIPNRQFRDILRGGVIRGLVWSGKPNARAVLERSGNSSAATANKKVQQLGLKKYLESGIGAVPNYIERFEIELDTMTEKHGRPN